MENDKNSEEKFNVLENYKGQELTYKELCEILGWTYQNKLNDSKKAQFKKLGRYCEYEPRGKGRGLKYVILELYDKAKDDMDKRKMGNNSKYGMDIEITMLYVLNQHKSDHLYVSCGRALELAKIVNDNYRIGRREILVASKVLGVNESYLYNFYDKYNQELVRIFERGLKSMRSRCVVLWNKVTMVAKEKVDIQYNALGQPVVQRGKVVYDIKTVHSVATEDERRIITEAEEEVLKNMGYTSLKQVFVNNAWRTFKSRVEAIISHKANIKFYYDGFDIIINKKGISRIVSEDQAVIAKLNTNEAIVEKLDTSIQKKSEKLNDKEGVEYANNMSKLNKTLIDDSCSLSLSDEIDKLKNKPIAPKQEQLNIYDTELPF